MGFGTPESRACSQRSCKLKRFASSKTRYTLSFSGSSMFSMSWITFWCFTFLIHRISLFKFSCPFRTCCHTNISTKVMCCGCSRVLPGGHVLWKSCAVDVLASSREDMCCGSHVLWMFSRPPAPTLLHSLPQRLSRQSLLHLLLGKDCHRHSVNCAALPAP